MSQDLNSPGEGADGVRECLNTDTHRVGERRKRKERREGGVLLAQLPTLKMLMGLSASEFKVYSSLPLSGAKEQYHPKSSRLGDIEDHRTPGQRVGDPSWSSTG